MTDTRHLKWLVDQARKSIDAALRYLADAAEPVPSATPVVGKPVEPMEWCGTAWQHGPHSWGIGNGKPCAGVVGPEHGLPLGQEDGGASEGASRPASVRVPAAGASSPSSDAELDTYPCPCGCGGDLVVKPHERIISLCDCGSTDGVTHSATCGVPASDVGTDTPTKGIGWYISDTHARRAIGYLTTIVHELRDYPVPFLASAWAEALEKTMDWNEPSPIGPESGVSSAEADVRAALDAISGTVGATMMREAHSLLELAAMTRPSPFTRGEMKRIMAWHEAYIALPSAVTSAVSQQQDRSDA